MLQFCLQICGTDVISGGLIPPQHSFCPVLEVQQSAISGLLAELDT